MGEFHPVREFVYAISVLIAYIFAFLCMLVAVLISLDNIVEAPPLNEKSVASFMFIVLGLLIAVFIEVRDIAREAREISEKIKGR